MRKLAAHWRMQPGGFSSPPQFVREGPGRRRHGEPESRSDGGEFSSSTSSFPPLARLITLRYEADNRQLGNSLLAISPRWILNPARHEEEFGKCAVIGQFWGTAAYKDLRAPRGIYILAELEQFFYDSLNIYLMKCDVILNRPGKCI